MAVTIKYSSTLMNYQRAQQIISKFSGLRIVTIPIGVVGADEAAKMLRDRFVERNARIDGIITDSSRPTTRKTRVVAHSQQMVRADREDRSPISSGIEDRVITAFNQALSNADAALISDYDKGLLTPRVPRTVIELAQSRARMVCLDPKIRNFAHYREVDRRHCGYAGDLKFNRKVWFRGVEMKAEEMAMEIPLESREK